MPDSVPVPHSRLARSHNRRFHVRFPGVDSDEHLLNYYSCALVADILLQGHLYITENYFAFYSNIFGRKTQILLPVTDVIKVTKERTAKIIPNAVGIYTVSGKYVFGSLLSRNTTYQLMQHVWLKSADPDTTVESSSEEEVLPPTPVKAELFPRISARAAARRQCPVAEQLSWDSRECFGRIEENVQTPNGNSLPRTTMILLAATLLLVVLFLLATVLVYRVTIVHGRNAIEDGWPAKSHNHRLSSYLELLKQQQDAVEEEILRITNTLKNRLTDLGQVRQSIDKISSYAKKESCSLPKENSNTPST